MRKIVLRADAAIEIGTGHVMRCLTLANALREQGADCTFVCRAHARRITVKRGAIPLELIEIQSGSYLGEDDIVRLGDRYGHA